MLTRINHCLVNNSIMTFALELIWHTFRYQFIPIYNLTARHLGLILTQCIKVVELKDKTQVGGRVKRDVSVADESGTARVSVWEGNVNVMEKDRSYCLKNFMV